MWTIKLYYIIITPTYAATFVIKTSMLKFKILLFYFNNDNIWCVVDTFVLHYH